MSVSYRLGIKYVAFTTSPKRFDDFFQHQNKNFSSTVQKVNFELNTGKCIIHKSTKNLIVHHSASHHYNVATRKSGTHTDLINAKHSLHLILNLRYIVLIKIFCYTKRKVLFDKDKIRANASTVHCVSNKMQLVTNSTLTAFECLLLM